MDKAIAKCSKPLYRAADAIVRYLQTESTGAQVLSACINLAARTNLFYKQLWLGSNGVSCLGPLLLFKDAPTLLYVRHRRELLAQRSQLKLVMDALKQYQKIIADVELEVKEILSKLPPDAPASAEYPLAPRDILNFAASMRFAVAADLLNKMVIESATSSYDLPPEVVGARQEEPGFEGFGEQTDGFLDAWCSATAALGLNTPPPTNTHTPTLVDASSDRKQVLDMLWQQTSAWMWKFSGTNVSEYFEKATAPTEPQPTPT
jgi:hypothetical protein